ncbi:MAG TPA: DUF4259 domain-containing protein, partial [Streptosporangiaceae bacterium]|nr:DUF4259 domain-containing protein [Streptosporangiaceae bacterium]
MGTWGIGPFDNDTAADFAGDLDDALPGEREALVRGVLTRTVRATGYLDEAQEAVAAAALIAAQCPGGRPVETVYGPEQPLPVFPEDLRELAARALDRALAGYPGLEMWVGPADAPQWLAAVAALRDVLGPRLPSPDVIPEGAGRCQAGLACGFAMAAGFAGQGGMA